MERIVWFLTGNAGKLEEARHHFASMGIEVRGLEVPNDTIVEPQATSLREVATSKIQQALPHLPQEGGMLMVEDAGLFVSALNGFPGVYSSYAHETIGCQGMVKLLSHLVSEDPLQAKKLRACHFEAVAALWDGEQILYGHGVCPGSIAMELQGDGGFGFDPVFIPSDLDEHGEPLSPETLGVLSTHGQTFASVSLETKHAFSHRRRALDDLLQQLPRS